MWRKYGIVLCILLIPQMIQAQDISIISRIRQTPALQKEMQAWIEQVVKIWRGDNLTLQYPQDPIFQKPLGVFITAKKDNEVRACVGTIKPQEKSLADEILKNLPKAFRNDPRHRPVQSSEISGMAIYVSALSSPKLLSKPYQIDPAREAILLRSGSKQAVALPGEAKTLRYLLAFLKAKAGLKREDFQLYRLKSESLEVLLPNVLE